MRVTVVALCLAVVVAGAGLSSHAQGLTGTLRIAVVNTPDVLLDELIPAFERITGYDVTLEIGEEAFDVARNGKADLVIAHYGHADAEAFMADGLGRWPRMVFSNQAVLVGPSSDPAGIRGLTDAAAAIARIAERGGEFLVNNSPTERYLVEVLWRTAGSPAKGRWQVDLGLREQAAIERAAQRGAYTSWGLVPFVRLQQQRLQERRPLGLDVLVAADPLLQRMMASIVVNPARIQGVDEAGAIAFERYLLDPSTQARIRAFRHHGLSQQTWWPAGRNNAGSELSLFGN
jgi:tungstate transport system substrate-binding protein